MRLLLVCHDAGGTIPPVLALAEEAVEAGHDVTVLSQPSVRSRAEAAGATFVPFSSIGDYARDRALEDQLDVTGAVIVGRSTGDDVNAIEADVLVVDANLAGALAAAEARPEPSAVLLHSMYRTFVDVWFGELWGLLGPFVNETRAAFGRAPADDWTGVFAGHDRLLSVVPETFDAPVDARPATMRHVGFLVPHAEPAATGPRVLVASSTTFQAQSARLHAAIDALGAVGVPTVVTTAGHAVTVDPPPNVEVVDFAPHAALLPHVDVMVTHAGLGSVAAALHHGVPLVCTPISRDQPLNAARVASLGAGIALDVGAGTDEIAAAVRALLDDPSYRAAARSLADESRAAGGAAAAITDLARLARA